MNYKDFSEEITRLIRPQSYPLGLKLVKSGGQLPEDATRPSKYGVRISLCQWTNMARRWGRPLGVVAEDINCTPCLAALGLKRMESSRALSQYFLEMGYMDSIELAEKAVRGLDPIPAGEFAGVAVFPLEMASVDPDVVLIYGNPAQMARLAAGYLYHSGELIESRTTGFGISCLSAVKPNFTGKPAFVHPGRGERILAGTDESEMFLTLPASSCESLLDGLRKTQEKGTRYPVQSYLIYQPPTIKPMRNLAEKLTD
ncbi:MAG: DUF169 domain-containing protein [Deltaproteobacteria bacterium]|nr:DUF169 domain-containing protein [Deltaproteobacteria bacterium]